MAQERQISRKVASDAALLARVIIEHSYALAALDNKHFGQSFRKILEHIDAITQKLDINIGFVEWQARSHQ